MASQIARWHRREWAGLIVLNANSLQFRVQDDSFE